ncbi:hypothetical protein PYW07_014802 [Mythimna separata]|nr:hypothetical protein PYW07_014802 [Mythimna separata]
MSAHKLRRVAMCCLASPQGRRQHLAVSHEKGMCRVTCARRTRRDGADDPPAHVRAQAAPRRHVLPRLAAGPPAAPRRVA